MPEIDAIIKEKQASDKVAKERWKWLQKFQNEIDEAEAKIRSIDMRLQKGKDDAGYGVNFEDEISGARRRLKWFKILWYSALILIALIVGLSTFI